MGGYNTGPRVALSPRFASAALALSGCNLTNTADEAYFDIPFKCKVVYAACAVTTVVGAADGEVKFDRRIAAGNDTGRTDGTIANITIPNGTAIGQVVYDKAAQTKLTEAAAAALVTEDTCHVDGGVWRNSKCDNEVHGYLEPGMEVVVQVITGSATGNVQPILVVDMLEEVMGNLSNMTETA
jgi:hypothetical protein